LGWGSIGAIGSVGARREEEEKRRGEEEEKRLGALVLASRNMG
jgi:hypothetical protein